MLAAWYRRHGPPLETLELLPHDPGTPAAHEVIVAVEAAPVHIADLLYIEGKLPIAPAAPAIAGIEGVGRVIRCGADVREWQPGSRVFLPRRSGTWATQVKQPAAALLPAPAQGEAVQLCLVPINAPTAWFLIKGVVELQRGEWLIQNAANSNCGRYMIAIARELGLRSVNVVRRSESIAELRALGADVVLQDGADLAVRVAAATGGAALRLGIDAVAGSATQRLADCLTTGAALACYGRMSGEPCCIAPETLYLKNLRLQGFFTPHYEARIPRDEWLKVMMQLASWVADGVLVARIAAAYPLSEVQAALRHEMATGAARDGKIVVLPQQ